jgi:hypothetical protein
MRLHKYLILLACLIPAAAQAHVPVVPFTEIGSLQDAHKAAFTAFQPYRQVNYNIVTDAGAACNGDVQTLTRTVSITSGTKNLSATASTWSSGDVGKTIWVPGTTFGSSSYTTIATFTNSQNVVLTDNASTTISAVSTAVTFGTDDAAKFVTFNTWAKANQGTANQVVLTIPSGSSCWFGTSTQISGISNAWASGIKNLTVRGTGATISGLGGSGFWLGGNGICQAGLTDSGGCSARIQTVSAGSSTIQLTAASLAAGYISRFSVGKWILVGGLDVQGIFQGPYGYPVNLTYFEYREIISVNSTTGVITLDGALTNSYLSTWPGYNSGNAFEADSGGPASIWVVGGADNTWNTAAEYIGLTISQAGQTYSPGRSITYTNVTFTGSYCGIPSQNQTWTVTNGTMTSCFMEVDKLIGTLTLDNVAIAYVDFQSNSVDSFVTRNGTTFTTALIGTAKSASMTDTTIASFRPGASAYGNTIGPVVCTRCAITALTLTNAGIGDFGSSPWPYTMSGGVISFPVGAVQGAGPPQRWASPINLPMVFSTGTYNSIGNFKVTGISGGVWPASDNQTVTTTITIANGSTNLNVPSAPFVSGDVGKTIAVGGAAGVSSPSTLYGYITAFVDSANVTLSYPASRAVSAASQTVQWGTANVAIQTNQAGGFPSAASLGGGTVTFTINGGGNPLGAQQFTCDACTGDPLVVAMNTQNGATPLAPLGTYSTASYAPTSAQGSLQNLIGIGKLVSLTIDVTQAYTGTGTATLNPTGQFHNFVIKQSAWTVFDWVPVINLKQAGTRVITPTGVTCNGSPGPCSGDTIDGTVGYPGDANSWVMDGVSPYMGSTFSGGVNPQFTMTIQTDQTP